MRRLPLQLYRAFSANATKQTTTPKPADPLKNVVGKSSFILYLYKNKNTRKIISGLSSKCVAPNDARAVPGTGKDYKVPEYFGFNKMSYSEAEVEMEKFRIPQPIAPRK